MLGVGVLKFKLAKATDPHNILCGSLFHQLNCLLLLNGKLYFTCAIFF